MNRARLIASVPRLGADTGTRVRFESLSGANQPVKALSIQPTTARIAPPLAINRPSSSQR